MQVGVEPVTRYRAVNSAQLQQTPYWSKLSRDLQDAVQIVSAVFPFRTNEYILANLIDWTAIPDDPIFRLIFPHRDMLEPAQYKSLSDLLTAGNRAKLQHAVLAIRAEMNPHPAGQMSHNVPTLDGQRLTGVQHKYRETVLFFPSAGQTCHAYCAFCFRWPQFVGTAAGRFGAHDVDVLERYLRVKKDVTDVLFTGGDPMIMNATSLRQYLQPLLSPHLERIQSIRIGTKSISYWPQRFVTDEDADDILRLFDDVTRRGRHLALMAHISHPRELDTSISRRAIERVRATGAIVRTQSPIIKHVNDNADTWEELWNTSVRLGMIPYYMFVERDTGPREYFEVTLHRAYEIFRQAYSQVSGLARSVRGPVMSAFSGKILIDGVVQLGAEQVFALQLIQGRQSEWVRRPFYARLDMDATWFDHLKPAFGEERFFFDHQDAEGMSPPNGDMHVET
jgi:KamA family protein